MLIFALLAGAAAFAGAALIAARAPRWLSTRSTAVTVVAAVALGCAALAVGGAPTGSAGVDGLMRFGFVAATTLAARYAPRQMVALSTAIAVVASLNSPLEALAFVAAGLVISMLLVEAHEPAIKAIAGGVLALVALDLRWPRVSLAPALVAALIVAPLIISGYRSAPGRMKKPLRRAFVVIGAFGAVAVLGAGAGIGLARGNLSRGLDAGRRGLQMTQQGDQAGAAGELMQASSALRHAERSLDAPWTMPALAIPVVAQHVRALRTIASAGAHLGDVGGRTVALASPRDLRATNGQFPVDRLASLKKPLEEASSTLATQYARLRLLRSPWLVGPLQSRLRSVLGRVSVAKSEAHSAAVVADILPDMLGQSGHRNYFLAIDTPVELRASAGFIGNYAEISADHGRLSLGHMGRAGDLNLAGNVGHKTLQAPPDYVDRYSRFDPANTWQNVTMSPDFPTVAGVIENLYPQSGGNAVDGVIAIDPFALASVLEVIGPVSVPDWPEPITSKNATDILLYQQYIRYAGQERVSFLGEVAQATWQRLTDGSPSLASLGRAVASAASDKHLLLASNRPHEEQAFVDLGISGRLAPVNGDFLGVITQNAGGNKIDWFLKRTVSYRVDLNPASGDMDAKVTVKLQNLAPSSGLPSYVIGNVADPKEPTGTNKTYLSIYTPWYLKSATKDGQRLLLESENELDRHVYSTYIAIPPGGTVTVEMSLHGALSSGTEYHLDVNRQPTVVPDQLTTSVSVGPGWRLESQRGDPSSTVTLTAEQRRDTHQALSLVRVAP